MKKHFVIVGIRVILCDIQVCGEEIAIYSYTVNITIGTTHVTYISNVTSCHNVLHKCMSFKSCTNKLCYIIYLFSFTQLLKFTKSWINTNLWCETNQNPEITWQCIINWFIYLHVMFVEWCYYIVFTVNMLTLDTK